MENLLPENDIDYLNDKGYNYEVIPFESVTYLILKDVDFPAAYKPQVADVMIQIPPGYPNAQLDMFWTCPDIKLQNDAWPQQCEHHEDHIERNWQRWSRHSTWRPGVDTIKSFIASVRLEIAKGI